MRLLALILGLALLIGAAGWYYKDRYWRQGAIVGVSKADPDDEWLEALMSRNPRESEAAAKRVKELGPEALPLVREILQHPQTRTPMRRAALRAAGLIGQPAAAAVPDVAPHLYDPDLTEEAAVALSFMGPEAFTPLRDALTSGDAVIRREALRSIGKLTERAPLAPDTVLPLLVEGLRDPDEGVRAVGATYIGIIRADPAQSVLALASGLADPDVGVRRASAAALASFSGPETKAAIPALRKATGDTDPDVAREAGATLAKLQPAPEAPVGRRRRR